LDLAKENRNRQARAVELHDEAKALYDRGLYRRAIAKLEAALELDPDGKELVYNLALIHEKLVEPDVAEKYYLRYIEMESDPRARERTSAIVKRLQAAKKSLKADIQERALASASSATVALSGTAVAGPGASNRRPSPMVLVLGGVAVAAAAVGIGFGVSALTTHPDGLTTGPGTTVYDLQTRAEAAHNQAIVADLAFAASFVVGAATAVLYLLETRSPRPAPSVTMGPQAAPNPGAQRAPNAQVSTRLRLEVPF
jgi:tetratricopeptide (TPR) repeat protein